MTTWVILEKNKNIYKYKLFDNAFLFHKDIMDLQIEGWNTGVPMDYDDIICIKTDGYYKTTIPSIPKSLREISIKDSNITEVPVFPPSITSIQIINSKIEMNDQELKNLHTLYPQATIQIANYDFMKKQIKRVEVQEALDEFEAIRGETHQENNVLSSSQTVHISSINNCVIQAIEIIKKEYIHYPLIRNPIDALLNGEPTNSVNSELSSLRQNIKRWNNDPTQHSVHRITFKELFGMIMTIIENHLSKDDMKERLITELMESQGLCFTGRINRMVNALVGFMDHIQVGLSVKEETQLKITALIKKLIDKKIKKEKAKEEMMELFSGLGEEDNISDSYKQANLEALDEFHCEESDELDESGKIKKE